MKRLLVGILALGAMTSYSAVIKVATCTSGSSTWPVSLEVSDTDIDPIERVSHKLIIEQENPQNLFKDKAKSGLDTWLPFNISISNGSLNRIIPNNGLNSTGGVAIKNSKLLKRKEVQVGLISDDVNGIMRLKGNYSISDKSFIAEIITVDKNGKTHSSDLNCINTLNK